MSLKAYRPTTQVRRKATVIDYSELSKKKPEKNLTRFIKRSVGRDNLGHISTRHKGGGVKKKYRTLGSLESHLGQIGKVISIEYDPFRSSFIALVEFENKSKMYILAPFNLKIGDLLSAAEKTEIKKGNRMKLKAIPSGTMVHDVEIYPGQGGRIVRSAGTSANILSKADGLVQLKMPSGEIRKINENCFASIGQLSNISNSAVRIGKAGRNRWKGIRPTVRGKAMHPAAHPHGGGEGVNPIGLKHPKTPWGKNAYGVKTRKKNKYSNKFIVKFRK